MTADTFCFRTLKVSYLTVSSVKKAAKYFSSLFGLYIEASETYFICQSLVLSFVTLIVSSYKPEQKMIPKTVVEHFDSVLAFTFSSTDFRNGLLDSRTTQCTSFLRHVSLTTYVQQSRICSEVVQFTWRRLE
jgi:hypothetical protein